MIDFLEQAFGAVERMLGAVVGGRGMRRRERLPGSFTNRSFFRR